MEMLVYLFDDFPKIFSVKVVRRPVNRFRAFPKTSEGSQNFSEEEPMMFRSYLWNTYTPKYFLRDYVTNDYVAMVIFSLLKITCYFHVNNV